MAASNTTTAPKFALLYSRVSTQRQATEGVSLEAQVAKTRAHAQARGWMVTASFQDAGLSGKLDEEDRPGLRALLETVKSLRAEGHEPVVVVYSISRLARSRKLFFRLVDEHQLEIASPTETFDTTTPMGKAMLGMVAVFMQLEVDMVSERTRDALAEKKAQGHKLGQKTMKDLAPDTVALVKQMYASGLSTQQVADELNRQKIPTPTGRGQWWKTSVRIALKQ